MFSFFQRLKNRVFTWFRLKLFSISRKTLRQYFNLQRNLKWRIFFNLAVFITLVFCPYLDKLYQGWVESEPYHMCYIILICSVFNLYFIRFFFTLPGFSFLHDIKFFLLKSKSFWLYMNSLLISFKKYSLFVWHQKALTNVKLFFEYIDFILSKFLFWRPLFKRFSYFGNFRLTNSKFYKN